MQGSSDGSRGFGGKAGRPGVGSGAGAQWALDGPRPALRQLVWLAGALRPLGGWAGRVGQPLARWMAGSHWVHRLAAWHARDPRAVRRLIEGTGSHLGPAGVQAYADVWRQPAHVAGTLAMMAGWDLAPLQARLPRLPAPVLWLHGTADRTVRPEEAEAVGRPLPGVDVLRLPGLGHLLREEAPDRVSELALQALALRCAGRAAVADVA